MGTRWNNTATQIPPAQRRPSHIVGILARNLHTKRVMDTVLRLHWVQTSTQEPLDSCAFEGDVALKSVNPTWLVDSRKRLCLAPDGCEKDSLEAVIVAAGEQQTVLGRWRVVLHELSWVSREEFEHLPFLPINTLVLRLNDDAFYFSPEVLLAMSMKEIVHPPLSAAKKTIELRDLCNSVQKVHTLQAELTGAQTQKAWLANLLATRLLNRKLLLEQRHAREEKQKRIQWLQAQLDKGRHSLESESESMREWRARCPTSEWIHSRPHRCARALIRTHPASSRLHIGSAARHFQLATAS